MMSWWSRKKKSDAVLDSKQVVSEPQEISHEMLEDFPVKGRRCTACGGRKMSLKFVGRETLRLAGQSNFVDGVRVYRPDLGIVWGPLVEHACKKCGLQFVTKTLEESIKKASANAPKVG